TADSCLLSLSSIASKDFIARARGLSAEEAERLTRWTPLASTGAMVVLVLLALARPTTLWNLLVIKFEILIQLSPAFVLGTWHDEGDPRAFAARDILLGLAAGLAVALGLYLSGQRNVGGLHAGTLGVGVNYLACFVARRVRRSALGGS
ncbi:MAG: sodium:solute symporter family protein, partial [Acidobacteria bacterium]|nr:sodium:solute symporter family protein [Acidobacteriota bacterium]